MNLCCRCGRRLKNASPSGMGPVCELAVLGPAAPGRRARKVIAQPRDTKTRDLFAEDLERLEYVQRVDALLGSISLEMSA